MENRRAIYAAILERAEVRILAMSEVAAQKPEVLAALEDGASWIGSFQVRVEEAQSVDELREIGQDFRDQSPSKRQAVRAARRAFLEKRIESLLDKMDLINTRSLEIMSKLGQEGKIGPFNSIDHLQVGFASHLDTTRNNFNAAQEAIDQEDFPTGIGLLKDTKESMRDTTKAARELISSLREILAK